MNTITEKQTRFAIEVVYNGVEKNLQVDSHEQVKAVLQRAIAEFHITQNPHLLSLFRENGAVVREDVSVEAAGLQPGELLYLRPNTVKGGGDLLHVAADLLTHTFHAFRDCGRGRCECVAYWIGANHANTVDAIEHPVHSRSRFGYEIDTEWLADFWKRLAVFKRSVKAQVHTHPGEAFHSATDDEWPIVSQPGFLSIVIPNFGVGPICLTDAWIGRLGKHGTWGQISHPSEVIQII